MKFWEAMKALGEGKKVRVKSWPVKRSFIYVNKGHFYGEDGYCRVDDVKFDLIDFNEEWEIYEEQEKTYSFWEMLQETSLKGKKFRRKAWINEHNRILKADTYVITLEEIQATDWIEVKDD